MSDDGDERRRSRWAGLVGVSAVRLWKQATRTATGRIAATTVAVALTIGFLLIVTGVALGLADGGVVTQDDADVRVAPGESGTLSSVDGVERPRLGAANERAEQIRSEDGVDHASPVLAEPVRLNASGDSSRIVMLVGVVPDEDSRTVAGLPTDALEPGDPHYANGSYDGSRTGEIVLSRAAAEDLDVADGDELAAPGAETGDAGAGAQAAGGSDGEASPSFTVTDVERVAETDDGSDVPVALVHLSELQSLAGADDGELADRVLAWGDADAAESAAAEAYPDAAVESERGADPSSLFGDGLAFATSLVALVVGVVFCASFVATTVGMTVNEDRRMLAVLEAIGFPTRSRLAVVAASTQFTTLCGALGGIVVGVGGIVAVNAVAGATVASGAVAAVHPIFVPYAVGVALLSGLIAVPYPLAIAARTTVLEEVGQ